MGYRLTIIDILKVAEGVLGEPAPQLRRTMRVPGAESALAAPFANFDGVDFYPDPIERAAICCSRLLRNHPLLKGNNWVAYECMREMLERAEIPWPRPSEDVDEIATMVERLAAREVSERDFVVWVRGRTELDD